jgi:glycyl-tRNA synthetase
VKQLGKWVQRDDWHEILPAFARCVRITRDLKDTYSIRPDDFYEAAEKALYKAFAKHKKDIGGGRGADELLSGFEGIIPQINQFFDTVLVMDENKSVRENRLALLQGISGLAAGISDFSQLDGF